MDDSKTTPPDPSGGEPGWGERRRRPEPPPRSEPPRAEPPRPDDEPRPADEPRPSDEPRPHGDPLFGEQPRDYRDPYGPDEPYGRPPPPRPGGLDFSALFVLIDALRRAAPADVQDRMTAFIREGLLTLRSLIDWYLEKLDRPKREPEVEDIPID